MKTTTKQEFVQVLAQLPELLPHMHCDQFPSYYHHEVRITPKACNRLHLLISWYPSGIIVCLKEPKAQPHLRTQILALHIPSITPQYIVATVKKTLAK